MTEQHDSISLLPDERLDTVNEAVRLIQNKKGLTFGTDAFLLAAYIREQKHVHAVELGSGTGIIPLLLLAKGKVARVSAVEIQPTFASLIERNAAINGATDRLSVLCRDIRDLTPADIGGEVPLVFSNPPYMTVGSGKNNLHNEKAIARHEHFGSISDFCRAASRLLKHGGRFVLVYRPDRLSELFAALHDTRLEPKRMTLVHADAHHEPSCVLIEAVKGGAPSMRVSPPLFLYEETDDTSGARVLTKQAREIYDTCSFIT